MMKASPNHVKKGATIFPVANQRKRLPQKKRLKREKRC
jgi:hypothetical protein